MSAMDLILVHAPAVYDFRKRTIMTGPVSDMVPSTPIFEMYPLGLTTIGEYLERHGLSVRLFNLAGMMLHKKNFDVERNLAKLEANVFGIDLHWMPHCQGSIEVAKIIKRLHPDAFVQFGGLSSSIFHEDLIRYDCIDFVFRGDSTEEPMRMLMQRIHDAKVSHTPLGDLSDIPNLTWKDGTGAIHVNPLSWVPDDFDAVSLDYSYPMKGVLRHRDMMSYVPFKGWLNYPVTADLCCRGCNRTCATCGGSAYAFRTYFGRKRVAWRSPELLVRDIEHVQKHIWGPIFVLNDPLQAGEDYTNRFIGGLKGKLKNPIGFEFFGPPKQGNDLYDLFDRNLPDWSVEISAESHDDDVRRAFGKGHYKMEELEQTIVDALSHKNCSRFDLYFMTGIPTQTKESVLETGTYVKHLYELVGYDKRLVVMTSPMAPFLDVGSVAFDNPDKVGYRLRAKTLEEHRARMLMPSWKHIMNYESLTMSADDMCDATYQAALDINRVKGEGGVIPEEQMLVTELNILNAQSGMHRLDEMLENSSAPVDVTVARMREELLKLNENTVANKSDLDWPYSAKPSHFANLGKLLVKEGASNAAAALSHGVHHAASDFAYPDQQNGTRSAVYQEDAEVPSQMAKEGLDRKLPRDYRLEEFSRLPEVSDLAGGHHTVDTATGEPAEAELSSARVHSIFANIATRYDLFNNVSSFGQCNVWLNGVVEAAQVAPTDALLDLAAGTGDVTFAICAKTPPAVAVVTDFSAEMLEVAEERYQRGKARHVPCHFQVVDAQDVPYSSGMFDVVTCAYGVRNMPDRSRALAEAYRLLKPGGRYVVLEFGTPPDPRWRKLYHWYLNNMIPFVGGVVTKDRAGFEYLRDSIRAFPEQETFASMLADAGFRQVTYKNYSGGIAVVYTAIK